MGQKKISLMRKLSVVGPGFCHLHGVLKRTWWTSKSFNYLLLLENFRTAVVTFQYLSQILMFTASLQLQVLFFHLPFDHLKSSLRNQNCESNKGKKHFSIISPRTSVLQQLVRRYLQTCMNLNAKNLIQITVHLYFTVIFVKEKWSLKRESALTSCALM